MSQPTSRRLSRRLVRATALAVAGLSLPGLAAQPASAAGIGQASPSAGRLDVVFRHDGNGTATDPNGDSLVHLSRIDGQWQSPRNAGGSVHKDSEIGLASAAADTLTVVVRTPANVVRTSTWTLKRGWGGWTDLATGVTGGPTITSYAPGKLAAAWRDSAGMISLRTWQTGGPWSSTGQLREGTWAGTGPTLSSPAVNKLLLTFQHDTFHHPTTMEYLSGDPLLSTSWDDAYFHNTTANPVIATPANGVALFLARAGATRDIRRFQPAVGGASAQYVTMGGPVAGSTATSRPGESTVPNTPVATWSKKLTTSSTAQADLTWRSDNGCLQSRTKTDPAENGLWTAATPIPTQVSGTRCLWPGRTGTLPLFKRTDTSEDADFQNAQASWGPDFKSGNAVKDWYSSRDAAIGLHTGYNWATVWAPRNWHPNAWVYRKGTSYLASDNLHVATATATKDYFVRRTDHNTLVGLNYGCTVGVGCTQPLLNLTSAAARLFWLKGADGKAPYIDSVNGVPIQPSECQGSNTTQGLLDLLACDNGSWGSGRGNFKGVWIDDLLLQLGDPGITQTHIANFEGWQPTPTTGYKTGTPITGPELQYLPFSLASWENGTVSLLTELKTGIAALRAAGKLNPDEGKVAINYKWTNYGFPWAPSAPTISPTSAAGRAIKAVDLIELEHGWIDEGVRPGSESQFTFQRRQAFVDQVHALGTRVLEEKTSSQDIGDFSGVNCGRVNNPQDATETAAHYATAQYNLSATLLNYALGDWVGDMCEYVNRGWDGYQLDLGQPLFARNLVTPTLPNGAQQRLFERGRVVTVPPGGGSVTISTTAGANVVVPAGSRWYATGTNTLTPITTATLTARRGAVILTPIGTRSGRPGA